MSHTWVEISASALKHNVASIRDLIGEERKLIAVVKANAYGHGLAQVAEVIEEAVDYFSVATVDEAQTLRRHGIKEPILVLAYVPEEPGMINWCREERVEVTVSSLGQAERLARLVKDGELRVQVKIDTGLGRLGIPAAEAVAIAHQIAKLGSLHIKGFFSHLADPFGNITYTKKQLEEFSLARGELERAGFDSQLYHLAKTTAILSLPDSWHNAVRLGIGLYGIWPASELEHFVKKEKPDFSLQPVLSWKTQVLQVKDYPANSFVSYGCTYQTRRQTRLAIIPVGYYEGFDRGLSNRGQVLINGTRCPVRGLVCMNMTIVDITDAGRVFEGDEVVLIGQQGDEAITAHDLAEMAHTINYEIVSRINPLIERKVVD
ncbi:MAG: alanine racemase [Candidatus Komeilibacteria bacterium RIFCSPLOWO2_02_FULL_48_11]|uniref:Alanine racemase n=2 Tax=Parcubacteria group TaxID=1794811 RepID=A0A1G2BXK5_9BACT|nr:MAG: alanine racemase [Candidatus Komeilibacteria bacterium RIFCSPLOWO2_02_FULL_48_11]